jgi:hypothetical protein
MKRHWTKSVIGTGIAICASIATIVTAVSNWGQSSKQPLGSQNMPNNSGIASQGNNNTINQYFGPGEKQPTKRMSGTCSFEYQYPSIWNFLTTVRGNVTYFENGNFNFIGQQTTDQKELG